MFTGARSLLDGEGLGVLVARAAIWELVPLVTLMAVAVVASPIPSALIALTTGATYGHLWGTVQVMIGAELGALIAFGLARPLGHDFLRRMFGDRVDAGLLVFASRLMPFVSLDITSYAAGLSRPHVWRFALATLAGIVPASFLLALDLPGFSGEAFCQ